MGGVQTLEQPYPLGDDIDYQSYSQFELFKITIPAELQSHYYSWYQQRLNRGTPFVRVIDYNIQEGCRCCSSSQNLTVYTERLFFLDKLKLSYPEALFFLKECIITLDQLFDEFGSFRVTDGMAGVNHRGKVKVWCNQNFAENLPNNQDNQFVEEQDVVCDLVDMIQEASDDYRFTSTLEGYIGNLTFSNTIRVISALQQRQIKVNKIFLDLKEYDDYMSRAIQAKRSSEHAMRATAYVQVPQVMEYYQVIPHEVQVHHPVIYNLPMAPVVPHYRAPTIAPYPNYSVNYSETNNPYSVLKLFQPPVLTQPVQKVEQRIHRVNKQQRALAPQKVRLPQANIYNRPVVERFQVTETDVQNLQMDIRRKEHDMRMKKKLRENYDQIPQVESMIVIAPSDDKVRRQQGDRPIHRQPSNPNFYPARQGALPIHQNKPLHGRPQHHEQHPMSIRQIAHQSEIFQLF